MIQRSGGEMDRIPLTAGRRTFGDDPASYAAARPDYPDGLYARLVPWRAALPRLRIAGVLNAMHLGVDLGTSGVKAVLLDAAGTVIGQ